MSSFSITVAVVGLAIAAFIMLYDIATDSGFAELGRPKPVPVSVDPSTFNPIVLSEWDYRCKELYHASRQSPNLWCPNSNCPDYEDDLPTEEYVLSEEYDSEGHIAN
jgi:hypothetical protein